MAATSLRPRILIFPFSFVPSLSVRMSRDLRQRQPKREEYSQECQNNRLQRLHALRLRNSTNSERQHRRSTSTHSAGKANGTDVQALRQKLRRRNDSSREQRTQEETKESDSDGGYDKLRDEPEQDLKTHTEAQVDGDGQPFAKTRSDEAQDEPADCDAEPEACCSHSRCEGRAFSDTDHENNDEAAQRD